jgi:hypothetical protein
MCILVDAKESFPLRFGIRHRQVPHQTSVLEHLCSGEAKAKDIDSIYNGLRISKEAQVHIKSG